MNLLQSIWPLIAALSLLLRPTATLAARDAATANPDSSSGRSGPAMLALAAGSSASASQAEEEDTAATNQAPSTGRSQQVKSSDIVRFWQNLDLPTNQTANDLVIIGGSAKVHGPVKESIVVIWGDAQVDSDVREDIVVVLGNLKLLPGAHVHGDAVVFLGTRDLAPGARIDGDNVNFPGFGLPGASWLREWFVQCVLKMRLLAPQAGGVWIVGGLIALIYFLMAAAFPRPMRICVVELDERPASTFLLGLLAIILFPLIQFVLLCTGVGILVIPFVGAAFVLAAMFGKVAFLEHLGILIGRRFTGWETFNPLLGFLLGLALITVLYMVPVFSLLVFFIVSTWGLGSVVAASLASLRRESPERPSRLAQEPIAPPAASSGPASAAPSMPSFSASRSAASAVCAAAAVEAAGAATPFQTGSCAPNAGTIPPVISQAALPEAASFPRAGFWPRMGAAFLDLILVSILSGLAKGQLTFLSVPVAWLLVSLGYFAGMWAWKGTTIGGIVIGLKVVRFDGQPLSFPVALVRGLAAAFSAICLFLGFFWIALDPEKQAWHDRIAGTIVLRIPRSAPLLTL